MQYRFFSRKYLPIQGNCPLDNVMQNTILHGSHSEFNQRSHKTALKIKSIVHRHGRYTDSAVQEQEHVATKYYMFALAREDISFGQINLRNMGWII